MNIRSLIYKDNVVTFIAIIPMSGEDVSSLLLSHGYKLERVNDIRYTSDYSMAYTCIVET